MNLKNYVKNLEKNGEYDDKIVVEVKMVLRSSST